MVSTCCRRRLGQSTLNSESSTDAPMDILRLCIQRPQGSRIYCACASSAFNGLKVAASAAPAPPSTGARSRAHGASKGTARQALW